MQTFFFILKNTFSGHIFGDLHIAKKWQENHVQMLFDATNQAWRRALSLDATERMTVRYFLILLC